MSFNESNTIILIFNSILTQTLLMSLAYLGLISPRRGTDLWGVSIITGGGAAYMFWRDGYWIRSR